jgi:hypothetical protein
LGTFVETFTAAELARRQQTALKDALGNASGTPLFASGANGALGSLFMRGANSNQTLFLVDGIRLNDPNTDYQVFLGGACVSACDSLEIAHGPQSTLYGGEAIGGVISLRAQRGTGAPSARVSDSQLEFDVPDSRLTELALCEVALNTSFGELACVLQVSIVDAVLLYHVSVAVSLELRRGAEAADLWLPRRSLLLLGGEARLGWAHYIAPRRGDSVSREAAGVDAEVARAVALAEEKERERAAEEEEEEKERAAAEEEKARAAEELAAIMRAVDWSESARRARAWPR